MRSDHFLIDNERVLGADFLPNRMLHRSNEREQIANSLRPVLDDEQPRNVLLHGPPGTGKSSMAAYVSEKLQDHDSSVKVGHVNCWRHSSRFQIYYNLLRDLGDRMLHRSGTPTDELVDRFERKMIENTVIVILDEVDQVKDDKILYDMARYTRTGVIMVANQENVFYDVDERIRSTLSSRKNIRFKSYSTDQLVDILKDRREWGLKEGIIDDSQLSMTADRSKGDARVAINALRIAAEEAENNERDSISDEDINGAVPEAVKQDQSESLEKLNDDQRMLYDIIKEQGKISSSDLYEKYREKADEPKVKRTLRNYLDKMEKYRLVKSKGKGTGTKYLLEE